uniref:Uncharacterized protein LOC114347558 n=1 Tax=Diabrotica virgifera virgifera TaxID=50390 RepID=A0A6P7H660_DIAVI
MNTVQKEILLKFGSDLIAIDGTHGLNPYNFELTTILVTDEFNNGFPVAFMFTNRKDTSVYELFFIKVKEIAGIVNAKVFMSDITNTFYNAWCHVMSPAEKRLFCAWHVDRAWQTNLAKISNTEKKSYVYKMLKDLQSILDIDRFIKSANNFLQKLLGDADTHSFGVYFSENYCNNFQEWAYCCRKGCGVNTNMHIESFHKVLKYFYLDGKKVKRLDKSIHKLLEYVRDKTVERIIKLTRGKSDDSTITSRHRAALTTHFSVFQCENNIFKLESENNTETHYIEKQKTTNCCEVKCTLCKICIHSYKCTCLDYLIKTTICKHIHYFVLQDKSVINQNENTVSLASETEVKQLVSQISSKKNSEQTIRNQIKEKALHIVHLADSEKVNKEQLKIMLDHVNSAVSVSSIPQTNFNIENPTVLKEPGNKKIVKQMSFYSTKNKRKKKFHNFSKSTPEELNLVQEMLNSDIVKSCEPQNDHKYL